MKTIFAFCIAFLVSCNVAVFAQTTVQGGTNTVAVNGPAGDFKFEEETYDFGTIMQKTAPNNKVSHEFAFVNSGDKAIKISQVSASCGCTTPKWSSEPVPQGKKGTILVEYDASRLGPFHKAVTITSDAKTPSKVIFIKGTVEQPAATSPLMNPNSNQMPKL